MSRKVKDIDEVWGTGAPFITFVGWLQGLNLRQIMLLSYELNCDTPATYVIGDLMQ